MKKLQIILCSASLALLLSACGGEKKPAGLADGASGNMEEYESTDVNAIVQAKPEIMVLPSDATLKNFNALKSKQIEGKNIVLRDYKKYLLKDDRAKRIFSTIQDAFQKADYPLNDLEQTLKQIENKSAQDMADNIQQDPKALLLNVANPDIILELDYSTTADDATSWRGTKKNNDKKNLSYTLTAIDAYTNKAIATISGSNLKNVSTTEAIQKDFISKKEGFMSDIQSYFSDILTRGRDITVRILVGKDSDLTLDEYSIDDEPYSDFIIDYIKTHTVKGAYKMQINTRTEMYFTNCRIKLLNSDGTQYGVYDWARDLAKKLRTELGLKVTNESQGLGEVVLRIDGLK